MTVEIWGHRGCRGPGNPPENSLAAFQEAIDQGASGIECDLFLTKDNHLVVFHDPTLERMTEGKGNITDYTLAELKVLHLKSDGGKGPLTDEQIPTYKEVLDLVERYRNTPKTSNTEKDRADNFVVNTEIKQEGIAKHVAKAIEKRLANGWSPQKMPVSSFDMANLRVMRTALPQIPIGALFEGTDKPWDISEALLTQKLHDNADIRPDTINLTEPSLTPEAIRMIKATGAQPVAWTYNEQNPDELSVVQKQALKSKLHDNGITMITDFPREMRSVVKADEISASLEK